MFSSGDLESRHSLTPQNPLSESYALLNEKLSVHRGPIRHRPWWVVICMVGIGILFAKLVWSLAPYSSQPRNDFENHNDTNASNDSTTADPADPPFGKPSNIEIIATVMYSHRDRTTILDCFLQQNLASNGGLLDKVIFVPETGQEEHLDWLEALVASTAGYFLLGPPADGTIFEQASPFSRAWALAQAGPLYIQMSSETVYIGHDTIASLVKTRLAYPDYFLVSANVVNQPVLSWVHHHLGVVRPYRPEARPPARPQKLMNSSVFNWRASNLPPWGVSNEAQDGLDSQIPSDYGVALDFSPPFKGHRWLPYSSTSSSIPTAVTQEVLSRNGGGKWPWTLGAQHHYSFLEHLENGDLERYKFSLWEYQHERIGMSFVCVWGADIVATRPLPGGKENDIARFVSVDVPQKLGRGGVVDGRALAVRFAHPEQEDGLESTDLLDRYKGLADEQVC